MYSKNWGGWIGMKISIASKLNTRESTYTSLYKLWIMYYIRWSMTVIEISNFEKLIACQYLCLNLYHSLIFLTKLVRNSLSYFLPTITSIKNYVYSIANDPINKNVNTIRNFINAYICELKSSRESKSEHLQLYALWAWARKNGNANMKKWDIYDLWYDADSQNSSAYC
jgi:hypothetical protein